MFVDETQVQIKAGKGGNGLTSFRREKYVAKGGPDGGDGGKGGDVIAVADNNTHTLAKLRYSKTITAKDGGQGKKRKAHGKSAEPTLIKVPVGTVVYEDETELVDLKQPGQQAVIAKGGVGGFGNAHFTSSTRQAPQIAELGEPGEEKTVRFELKTVADIGLVGLPNVGKSTLLSVISNAKPRIADYPFTTLEPNLGVVDVFEESLVVADIPGLIAGAHQGKGLGDDFLRHVERTKVILHLIDSTTDDAAEAYRTIQTELSSYAVDLTHKPQIVALTKIDASSNLKAVEKQLSDIGVKKVHKISSVAHKGLDQLLKQLLLAIQQADEPQREDEIEVPTITMADDPEAWSVEKTKGGYKVYGKKISGFAMRTDFNNPEGVTRLRDILRKQGINRELERLGAKKGDQIAIADKTLKW